MYKTAYLTAFLLFAGIGGLPLIAMADESSQDSPARLPSTPPAPSASRTSELDLTLIAKLRDVVYGVNADGEFREPSCRVRNAAKMALELYGRNSAAAANCLLKSNLQSDGSVVISDTVPSGPGGMILTNGWGDDVVRTVQNPLNPADLATLEEPDVYFAGSMIREMGGRVSCAGFSAAESVVQPAADTAASDRATVHRCRH